MRTRLLVVLVVGAVGCAGRSEPAAGETSASGGAPGIAVSRCVSLDASGIELVRPIDGCTGSLYVPTCTGTAWTFPGPGEPSTCPGQPCDVYYENWCTCDRTTGLVSCPGDAGADDGGACGPNGQDGGVIGCVGDCDSTLAFAPVCKAGRWTCPSGTIEASRCGIQFCAGVPTRGSCP